MFCEDIKYIHRINKIDFFSLTTLEWKLGIDKQNPNWN